MHFLDAWNPARTTGFSELDLVRLVALGGLLVIGVLLPGRWVARGIGIGIALVATVSPELGPGALRAAWAALWILTAWLVGRHRVTGGTRPRPVAGLESGTIGLLLGLALLTLLIVAVGRQNLAAAETRGASLGVVVIGLGLLQLMLRRDILRGAAAFATLGTGLQVLDRVAREATMSVDETAAPLVLLATVLTVLLVARIAWVRERDAGSAWMGDAHELHD